MGRLGNLLIVSRRRTAVPGDAADRRGAADAGREIFYHNVNISNLERNRTRGREYPRF